MPSYSGVWNLPAQMQAKASLQWPQGPGAPTSVSATAGDSQATVTFTAPTFTGVPPGITGYLATSSPGGITATGASSPLTVTGLSNGTAYTFGVQATNAVGYGAAGTSGSVSPAAPIALFAGGYTFGEVNNIDRLSLSSLGNATDYGDLTQPTMYASNGGGASSTRGVWAGGYTTGGNATNVIQYVTIATNGNALDFGDLIANAWGPAGLSNSTRAIFAGGEN
jgi:large repetitive protein